jgi:hypothetical protein
MPQAMKKWQSNVISSNVVSWSDIDLIDSRQRDILELCQGRWSFKGIYVEGKVQGWEHSQNKVASSKAPYFGNCPHHSPYPT